MSQEVIKMKLSIYITTGFFLILATSLAGFEMPKKIDTQSECKHWSKPTNKITVVNNMLMIECKHKSGLVEYVGVRL